MSNQKIVVKEGGLGLGDVLGVVFIVLKLVGVIHWSWIWVLCPFWIGIAILVSIIAIVAAFGAVAGIISAIFK